MTGTSQFSAYPLQNYMMSEREPQPEEDSSVQARITRLEEQYKETGMRRSVDAVIVTTVHGFPHVFVLQVANAFYKLPGGYLDPTEPDEAGLLTRLYEQLGMPRDDGKGYALHEGGMEWTIGENLGSWWRPHFDTFMYPYLPAHITTPKELKKLFLVHLPPKFDFGVPSNMKLLAIPIMEFYDNAQRYGPQLASLPLALNHLWFDALTEAIERNEQDFGPTR